MNDNNRPPANNNKPEALRFFTERTSWEQHMANSETPPEPTPEKIEQAQAGKQTSSTPSIAGEAITADHQEAELKAIQSRKETTEQVIDEQAKEDFQAKMLQRRLDQKKRDDERDR